METRCRRIVPWRETAAPHSIRLSTGELSLRLNDPDHPLGILAAVFFQMFPNLLPLGLRHVAERHPQKFPTGHAAFLDCQPFVALAGERG